MNVVYMPTAFDSAILLTYDVPETIGLIVGKGKVFCVPNVAFTLQTKESQSESIRQRMIYEGCSSICIPSSITQPRLSYSPEFTEQQTRMCVGF